MSTLHDNAAITGTTPRQPAARRSSARRRTGCAAQLHRQAERGAGTLVLIGGEAGVGKTRLCDELSDEARARASSPPRVTATSWKVRRTIRPSSSSSSTSWARCRRTTCAARSGRRLPQSRGSCRSSVSASLNISTPAELPRGGEPSRTVRCAAGLRRARRRTVSRAVVIEDLHWIDESSLALLRPPRAASCRVPCRRRANLSRYRVGSLHGGRVRTPHLVRRSKSSCVSNGRMTCCYHG